MKTIDILRKTRYSLRRSLSGLEKSISDLSGDKPRILFVAPHMSTGGMPQYLCKKIEILRNQAEIFCVEYSNLSDHYVVQRNRIKEMIGENYHILGDDKSHLLHLIDEICPDYIHFDDFVEFFVDDEICKKIFAEDRPYLILETCHSSNVSTNDKLWAPDKIVMVNQWMVDRFKNIGIPLDILEYPIDNFDRIEKSKAQELLGLDPSKKHIINIGLFTPGKNQGELINYARDLESYPVEFHFIGNQAPNFQDYWEPLMMDLPGNCHIWGERNDTDLFYQAADLFVFTSNWELNPIVIKESLSWNLPILMRRLDPYLDFYDENPLVSYLTNSGFHFDREYNLKLITQLLGLGNEN
jgi:glycosyltransferase involved in cell wall biosynthesis